MEESSAYIRVSYLEPMMSTEPEQEETMSDWCWMLQKWTRCWKECTGYPEIAHGFWRNYKPSEDVPVNLLTLVNPSSRLSSAEEQWTVKPGGLVHIVQTDSPNDGCSDYGWVLKQLLVPEWCSLRETGCLPPHLILTERTWCCHMSH